MLEHINRTPPRAQSVVQDVISVGGESTSNPLHMLTHDQVYVPLQQDDRFVMYRGVRVYVGYKFPFTELEIDLKDKAELEQALETTQAVGFGVLLYIYHRILKYIHYVPQFLANPAFVMKHGDALNKALRATIYTTNRNSMNKWLGLAQEFPIFMDTLGIFKERERVALSEALLNLGYPNALGYLDPKTVTKELLRESLTEITTKQHKHKFPVTKMQYQQIFEMMLRLGGHDLVTDKELVRITNTNWQLAKQYFKARKMEFNQCLSVVMTHIHLGRGGSPDECYYLIKELYDYYSPLSQWPELDNVIKYASSVVGPGKIGIPNQGRASTTGSTLSKYAEASKQNQYI